MYLLADADDPGTLRLASARGFRFIDMRVTLIAQTKEVQPTSNIRPLRAEDIAYLSDLAARSHYDSRFYVDGRFSREACDQLFRTWIERSCGDRSFAGAVFVAELNDRPCGYITCTVKGDYGEIGLIAVDERFRRRGLGQALLATGGHWFREQNAKTVGVVTQGRNISALRMYEQYGFLIESIRLWFHWWRDADKWSGPQN
jgi:ribosomal protein S18 acetylase RimI-like enzyme